MHEASFKPLDQHLDVRLFDSTRDKPIHHQALGRFVLDEVLNQHLKQHLEDIVVVLLEGIEWDIGFDATLDYGVAATKKVLDHVRLDFVD